MGTTIDQQTKIDTALNNMGKLFKQQIGFEEAKRHLYVLLLDIYNAACSNPDILNGLSSEIYTLRMLYEAISDINQSDN